jgi:hypothetical protein
VLTHDEVRDNEIFVGSLVTGTVARGWSIGKGRSFSEIGQAGISLSHDGDRVVVSTLPYENSLPKDYRNIQSFATATGILGKSIRTDGIVGSIVLMPGGTLLAARIDTPSFFSKKACIEKWNLNTGDLDGRFCDKERNVSGVIAASPASGRVAGIASQTDRSLEGQVYAVSGRINLWDWKSGSLIASSDEISHLVSTVQISPYGEWVIVDQELLHLSTAP